MTLSKLEINNLFREYNITVDLSGRCCILVGGNGVGKSTALRILDDICNSNCKALLRYPYESIRLTVDNKHSVNIKRSDFFPTKAYVKGMAKEYISYTYGNDKHEAQYMGLAEYNCRMLIEQLEREGVLFEFYANCCLNLPQSERITSITNIEKGEIYYQYTLENASTILNKVVSRYCDENIGPDFIEKRLGLTDSGEAYSVSEATFFGNMVQAFKINSKKADESEYVSSTLEWLKLKPEDVHEWKNTGRYGYLWVNAFASTVFGQLMGNIENDRGKCAKDIFLNINDFELKDNKKLKLEFGSREISNHPDFFFLHTIEQDQVVEINKLINRHYYPDDFVKAFNKRALEQYTTCISSDDIPVYYSELRGDLSLEMMKELQAFYLNPEVIHNIQEYFYPILVPESPLRIDIQLVQASLSDDMDPDSCRFAFYKQHWAFYKFYENEIDHLVDPNNRNESINLFQSLFSGYSQIKGITITPRGISLAAIHTKRKKHEHLELIESHSDEVSLNLLSSGEIKILLLLALAIFVENVVIILDEPELSLSIIWQEKLLPNLLSCPALKKIVVATHSPYIASDESLTGCISFIPD